MSTRTTRGRAPRLVAAVAADVRYLHEWWMGLAFPRIRDDPHPVTGAWRPQGLLNRALFRAWALLGTGVVAALYPLAVVGLAARYHARRIDAIAAALGLVGALLFVALAWGLLTAVVWLLFSPDRILALLAAALLAVAAAAVALVAARNGGRASTVLVAYPAGVTAVFLPPVMAALISPTVGEVILPESYALAVWLLDNVLSVGGLAAFLRDNFELEGIAYLGMWFGISVPVGWFLGGVTTLAGGMRAGAVAE